MTQYAERLLSKYFNQRVRGLRFQYYGDSMDLFAMKFEMVCIMDYLPICHWWNVLWVVEVAARPVYYLPGWVAVHVLPSRSSCAVVTKHCIVLHKRCNLRKSGGYRSCWSPLQWKRNSPVILIGRYPKSGQLQIIWLSSLVSCRDSR